MGSAGLAVALDSSKGVIMSASPKSAKLESAADAGPNSPREPHMPPDPIEPEPPPAPNPRDPDPYPRYEDEPPAQPIDNLAAKVGAA